MSVSPCETCTEECRNPERGCPQWRKWFVDWWNALVYAGPKPNSREVFQYEHPDRVREMNTAEWMAKQMEVKEDA